MSNYERNNQKTKKYTDGSEFDSSSVSDKLDVGKLLGDKTGAIVAFMDKATDGGFSKTINQLGTHGVDVSELGTATADQKAAFLDMMIESLGFIKAPGHPEAPPALKWQQDAPPDQNTGEFKATNGGPGGKGMLVDGRADENSSVSKESAGGGEAMPDIEFDAWFSELVAKLVADLGIDDAGLDFGELLAEYPLDDPNGRLDIPGVFDDLQALDQEVVAAAEDGVTFVDVPAWLVTWLATLQQSADHSIA